MKKHLVFNKKDCPSNMGQMQLIEGDVMDFAKERADLLPNPKIEGDRLTFDVSRDDETVRGFAMIQDVPDDFENS